MYEVCLVSPLRCCCFLNVTPALGRFDAVERIQYFPSKDVPRLIGAGELDRLDFGSFGLLAKYFFGVSLERFHWAHFCFLISAHSSVSSVRDDILSDLLHPQRHSFFGRVREGE